MSGIRVSIYNTERPLAEKDLTAYFSNPDHGGGKIASIHYPVFEDKAVIIFEDEYTAEVVAKYTHKLFGGSAYAAVLPKLQAFRKLQAECDPAVTAFLETAEDEKDEIILHGNIEYSYNMNTNTSYMTGTWYQLEWAWNYLNSVMKQQQKALARTALNKEVDDKYGVSNQRSGAYSFGRTSVQTDYLSRAVDNSGTADDNVNIQLTKSITKIPGETPLTISMPGDQSGAERGKSMDFLEHSETTTKDEIHLRDSRSKMQRTMSEPGNTTQKTNTVTGVLRSISIEDKDFKDLESTQFSHEGLTIRVYTGDIILSRADAIVNSGLDTSLGVSSAISQAAGSSMIKEMKAYFTKNGDLEVGKVMKTGAGQLRPNIRYVLHTVGPVWGEDISPDFGAHMLTSTFLNCLSFAEDQKLTSVVFPAISAGTFLGDIDVCAKCFLDAVLLFTYDQKGKQCLKEVHLVNIDKDTTANMIITIRQMLVRGMDLLTVEAIDERNRMKKDTSLFVKFKAGLSYFLFGTTKGHGAKAPPRVISNQKKATTPASGKSAQKPSDQAKNKPFR